jgi:hypothetical protein
MNTSIEAKSGNLLKVILKRVPGDILTDTVLHGLHTGSPDSRYGRIKRSVRAGDLIHLRRGLYALSKPYQRKGIDLFELAQRIYGPSYISLESALAYHGWIPEAVYTVTSVSAKRSREFKTPLGAFSYAHIPTDPFLAGVERVENAGSIFLMATPWRALADYVYVYKKDWRSLAPVVESLRVDGSHFQNADFKLLEALRVSIRSLRVSRFIDGVKGELLK